MKTKFPYLILIGVLLTSCQKEVSDLDALLLPCFATQYQAQGHDIKTLVDAYETTLIEEGVLPDASGSSYLEVWNKIAEDDGFQIDAPAFRESDPMQDAGMEAIVSVIECEREKLGDLTEKDPKWKAIFGSPESQETMTQQQVYQAMEEHMTEADLNSYYFRLKMFVVFDMANPAMTSQP